MNSYKFIRPQVTGRVFQGPNHDDKLGSKFNRFLKKAFEIGLLIDKVLRTRIALFPEKQKGLKVTKTTHTKMSLAWLLACF